MKTNEEIIQHLSERRLIKEADGNMELSHDILASLIAKKQRSLLEIKGMIRFAYMGYKENKTYLNPRQLIQIEPYLNRLFLETEEKDFIQASKSYNFKKKIRNAIVISGIGIILVALTISSLLLWRNALNTQHQFVLEQYKQRINEGMRFQKDSKYEVAIQSYNTGLDLLQLNEMPQPDSIKGKIEICENKQTKRPEFMALLQKADSILAQGNYISLLQADSLLDQALEMAINERLVQEKRNAWINRRGILIRDYEQRRERLQSAKKIVYANEIQERINKLISSH